jgi:diguanylate cyclase (GGDEF)-like protein
MSNKQETILVVDDEMFNVKVLADLLSDDYKIAIAKNGEQAIERVRTKKPDLILLDVIMPGMNGYEVCRILKENPQTSDIPIIFISALNEIGDEVKGLELGAADYISKPISPGLVKLRIKNQIELKRHKDLLQNLVNIDGLTQISNRRRFNEFLHHEWMASIRNQTPLSLILIDIDFFKPFNDTYGHVGGDECLCKVAETLSNTIKRSTDLIARYGGEEFACILPNADTETTKEIAEALRQSIENLKIPHTSSQAAEYVTISLGCINLVAEREKTENNLIELADKNLYIAKESGRNKSVI